MPDKIFINEEQIFDLLDNNRNSNDSKIEDVLNKALQLKGLNLSDVATLLSIEDDKHLEMLFRTALKIKQEIYGNRMVLFAPLYVSNYCSNNCLYCGFRLDNKTMHRTALTIDEVKEETISILEQGHKRVLMLMGEHHQKSSFDYFMEAIDAVYSVKDSKGSSIRRINVEIAPLNDDEFQKIKQHNIGTYTVFQETYHQETYKTMHPSGIKADYARRLFTMDRALANGLHDVGIGTLFGLFDYKFEVLAMIQHAEHLDKTYGVGPHTISIPRINPASNAPASLNIPYPVQDRDFKKLVAIIRCAVPYTGMILSTRESSTLRSELFDLGISQLSAGSRTSPGGYKQALISGEGEDESQFSLNDSRSSGEVIKDIIKHGFLPSYCTACYRLGRVGADFMDQAKPGLIKLFCQPNGITTFKEYLVDYADEETKQLGEEVIKKQLDEIPDENVKAATIQYLKDIEEGKRDLYF